MLIRSSGDRSVDKTSAFINTHYLSCAQAAAPFVLGVLIKPLLLSTLTISLVLAAAATICPRSVDKSSGAVRYRSVDKSSNCYVA